MWTCEDLVILLSLVASVTCTFFHYGLDNAKYCQSESVTAKWLGDDDIIRLYGKMTADHKFTECLLKLGPSSKASKPVTKIKFEVYSNNNCGIYLAVTESPHAFFEKDVTTLFNLSCNSNPGDRAFYSMPNNNIRILLHKSDTQNWNYNFIFNVSLSDHKMKSGMSTTIIIGIGILVAIAIPGIGCVVFRYLKVRNWSKRQFRHGDDGEDETSSRSPLSGAREHTRLPGPSRYSGLPGERTGGSHTCILASRGSDGRCTVCHRIHDDFAHFVEVETNNDTHGSTDMGRRCQVCHGSHDDFVHLVEIDGVTHVADCPAHHRHSHSHTTTVQSDGHTASPSSVVAVLSPPDASSSDDDLDLSGNDLIPPSYDNNLSPPSYDEAVTMPKPQEIVQRQMADDDEVNPLYQNLNSLAAES